MWRKKEIGTLGISSRERVLRVGKCTIFESASISSVLKVSQFWVIWWSHLWSRIEKRSRQGNGSRRMASSDVPFIHSKLLDFILVREMDLTRDWMTGFWAKNWWIPWQFWSLLRVILENSCLRLGRRNEEETRASFLSKRASSPTTAITLSIISCGISTDFTMRAMRWVFWSVYYAQSWCTFKPRDLHVLVWQACQCRSAVCVVFSAPVSPSSIILPG